MGLSIAMPRLATLRVDRFGHLEVVHAVLKWGYRRSGKTTFRMLIPRSPRHTRNAPLGRRAPSPAPKRDRALMFNAYAAHAGGPFSIALPGFDLRHSWAPARKTL